ncbi:MAG: hypothetical protein ACQETH_10865, partial [Candidatus Rifleibacteriota bacterium]
MKCNEIKNNIREALNLDCIKADKGVQTHLENCASCKNYFLYEEKLRKGFAEIADQQPPAELEARFMTALEKEEKKDAPVPWFARLSAFFNTFHYKTAFISCFIGFFAAILLQQTDHIQNTSRSKSVSLPAVSKSVAPQKIQSPEIKLSESDSSMIALKKNRQMVKKSDSLQREEQNVELKETEALIKMPENNYGENISTRMMAKKESGTKDRRAAPVTAMFRSRAPSASAPEIDSFAPEGKQQDLSENVVPDQRIAELEKIIDNYNLELAAGPLNIKTLAVKGLIPAEKLDYFAPPAGMNWFVQIK